MQAFRWQRSMQNHRLPSFFHTNTTALQQALWLGPDSTRLQHFPQVVLNLLNQWWGNPSKSFLIGNVIHNFYHVFCGMGYSPILLDPMRTHHGIWPRASRQHLPALGPRNPGHSSPIHQTIYHAFA